MTDHTIYDQSPFWGGVWRLIDQAPSLGGLRVHRLHLLAAHRLTSRGLALPRDLMLEGLLADARTTATRQMLAVVREAYGGRLLILKGPEIAEHYPDRSLRQSADVDILAEEPELAYRALIAAGFEPAGPYPEEYYVGLHHLRPLVLPGSPAPAVEIHRRPNWVNWSRPPSADELFDSAEPALSQAGMLAPAPEFHAVILLAHMWGEMPLRRVSDLIDLSLMVGQGDRQVVSELADRFSLARAWETTDVVARALFLAAPPPLPLQTWARDLRVPRDRTVFETHVRRWVSPWWAHPAGRASLMFLRAVFEDLTPVPGEPALNKLVRVREAITHPQRSIHEHNAVLGPGGIRPRHKRW